MCGDLGKEKAFEVLQRKMGNPAPEDLKEKFTGADKGQRQRRSYELDRPIHNPLEKGAPLVE